MSHASGIYVTWFNLGAALEASILILITFIACLLSYEVIKRINVLRPCFGLKMKATKHSLCQRITDTIATILIIPFALEILI